MNEDTPRYGSFYVDDEACLIKHFISVGDKEVWHHFAYDDEDVSAAIVAACLEHGAEPPK